jgi:hypothetical protein
MGCGRGEEAPQAPVTADTATASQPAAAEAAPPARWDIKSQKDNDGNVVAIAVYKNGGGDVHQELRGFSAQPIENMENGELVDVNCDGNRDIMLMEFLPAGGNVPYLYWIYNPASDRFECRPPSGQASCSLQFPKVDCEKGGFDTEERDSATTYFERRWEWRGVQLTLTREIENEFTENGQKKVTIRELDNGELKVTKSYIE